MYGTSRVSVHRWNIVTNVRVKTTPNIWSRRSGTVNDLFNNHCSLGVYQYYVGLFIFSFLSFVLRYSIVHGVRTLFLPLHHVISDPPHSSCFDRSHVHLLHLIPKENSFLFFKIFFFPFFDFQRLLLTHLSFIQNNFFDQS